MVMRLGAGGSSHCVGRYSTLVVTKREWQRRTSDAVSAELTLLLLRYPSFYGTLNSLPLVPQKVADLHVLCPFAVVFHPFRTLHHLSSWRLIDE